MLGGSVPELRGAVSVGARHWLTGRVKQGWNVSSVAETTWKMNIAMDDLWTVTKSAIPNQKYTIDTFPCASAYSIEWEKRCSWLHLSYFSIIYNRTGALFVVQSLEVKIIPRCYESESLHLTASQYRSEVTDLGKALGRDDCVSMHVWLCRCWLCIASFCFWCIAICECVGDCVGDCVHEYSECVSVVVIGYECV